MNSALFAVLLVLSFAVATAFADRPGGGGETRSVVYARHGMVASAHPLASQIGLDILKKGGSAVDAAIAANAALGFLEPMSCGVGGDLFAIVWDAKSGKLYGLNASGRCPKNLTPDQVRPTHAGTIPPFSPYVWTVPGCVDGWAELHGKFGRLPMKDLLAPAIRAAREGEPVPEVIAGYWKAAESMRDRPGMAATYLRDGRAPREGELFKNPDLAKTYEAIAAGGRDAFYRSPVAEAVVTFSKQCGGFFSAEDFAAHRSDWVDPISTDYRGVTLWEMPPNGQGLAALQMLNILETFDLKKMGRHSADFWHVMIEAKKLAYEDRARYYADPAFAKVPVRGLLSKDYARGRAKLVDMAKASTRLEAGHPALDKGDTTFLCTADAEGNMVSLIQSNYEGFGSGYAVEGWGFALQNRGALFSLKPDSPNILAPGKRPFHTIIPAFLTRDGKPWVAFGVMGGPVQPQGHVQIVVNLVDFGMNLQEAGDAARYRHSGSSEPTGTLMTTGGVVALENGVPDTVRRELERRGHRIESGGSYGGYQAIARDPVTGVYAGASESRKDGCAVGY